MGKKKAKEQSIDETHLIDRTMPKSWRCPHCLKRNKSGEYADECLLEHGMYLEHCPRCGYVHTWTLDLTEKFKKEVVNNLLEWLNEEEPPKIEKKYIEI